MNRSNFKDKSPIEKEEREMPISRAEMVVASEERRRRAREDVLPQVLKVIDKELELRKATYRPGESIKVGHKKLDELFWDQGSGAWEELLDGLRCAYSDWKLSFNIDSRSIFFE